MIALLKCAPGPSIDNVIHIETVQMMQDNNRRYTKNVFEALFQLEKKQSVRTMCQLSTKSSMTNTCHLEVSLVSIFSLPPSLLFLLSLVPAIHQVGTPPRPRQELIKHKAPPFSDSYSFSILRSLHMVPYCFTIIE